MSSLILNFICKYAGLSKAWALLDAWHIRIAGAAALLTGLAPVLVSLGTLITGFLSAEQSHNFAQMFSWAQGLPTNPAWLAVVAGLGTMGLATKLEKLEAFLAGMAAAPATPVAPAPAAPATPQPAAQAVK